MTPCSLAKDNVPKRLVALFLIFLCCLTTKAKTAPLPPLASFGADYKEHEIKPGETLSLIGQRFHTSVNAMKFINNLPSNTIASGKVLRFPIIADFVATESHGIEILGYRVYAAKNVLYLLAIARTAAKKEDWKEVLLFRQAGKKWVLLDSLAYMDYLGASVGIEPFAQDIDEDGNDECYIIGEYPCSAKDLCYSAYLQVPKISEKIFGVSIITYAPNAASAELTGPFLSIYEEWVGEQPPDSLDKYRHFVVGKAHRMLDKSLKQ